MSDLDRVDLVLKYALAVAGQEEWDNRELGPIHLVKHVYLADLAYADRHGGETFTGVPWRFYHFGPWCEEVYARLQPVVASVGATERRFPRGDSNEEGVRWTLDDERLLEALEEALPVGVAGVIKHAVRQFGADTPSLLAHVYVTRPMLRAAPGELLDFTPDDEEGVGPSAETAAPAPAGSPRAAREYRAALTSVRETLRRRLAERVARQVVRSPMPPPRYDDVFFEGLQLLDRMAGEPITAGDATLVVADDVWKSRGRRDPRIP